MNFINLINPEKSNVKFEIITFNDGEPHIKFIDELNHKEDCIVVSRITNPTELFILLQVGDILKRHGIEYKLFITYLMGMRMDRVMTFNEAFSLDIIANMINTMNADLIYIVEPHSDRSIKLINNSEAIMSYDMIESYMHQILCDNKYVCYPDRGAANRYKSLEKFNDISTIILKKTRDIETGNITGMDFAKYDETAEPDQILILDDLCDGGRTFIEAKKLLKTKYPNAKVNIFVTHMVNEKGLDNLANNFDIVYITNSYKDWDKNKYENVKVLNIVPISAK